MFSFGHSNLGNPKVGPNNGWTAYWSSKANISKNDFLFSNNDDDDDDGGDVGGDDDDGRVWSFWASN